MTGVRVAVDAVLFDAVGTLIRPCPSAVDVYCRLGAAHGTPLSREIVGQRLPHAIRVTFAPTGDAPVDHASERAKWREVVRFVFRDVGVSFDALFSALWDHFGQSRNWSLDPEVPDVWRELESRGYRLGVASNFDDRLTTVLAGLPPLDACRDVFWSSRVGFTKPHPQFFARVANALGLRPEKILLVGDDEQNDVVGAQAAGWQAIHLDRQGQCAAPHAIACLGGLLDRLP